MLFPKNDSCRLSPFFIPTCLHIIAKIFGANLVSGFWVKQRGGKAVFEGSEAEWDGWKGRKRRVARLGSDWGRNKDEDDDHWWRRCIAVSAAMMRPAKYRLRRRR